MIDYYAPDGNPCTAEEWYRHLGRKQAERERVLAGEVGEYSFRTIVSSDPEVVVSTVYLGLNHQWNPDAAPLFWETMIFGGERDEWCERYSSRESALTGHARIVDALLSGHDPEMFA